MLIETLQRLCHVLRIICCDLSLLLGNPLSIVADPAIAISATAIGTGHLYIHEKLWTLPLVSCINEHDLWDIFPLITSAEIPCSQGHPMAKDTTWPWAPCYQGHCVDRDAMWLNIVQEATLCDQGYCAARDAMQAQKLHFHGCCVASNMVRVAAQHRVYILHAQGCHTWPRVPHIQWHIPDCSIYCIVC